MQPEPLQSSEFPTMGRAQAESGWSSKAAFTERMLILGKISITFKIPFNSRIILKF